MMIVFVVMFNIPYDGNAIEGVYSKRELAVKYIEDESIGFLETEQGVYEDSNSDNYYSIVECEVTESLEENEE